MTALSIKLQGQGDNIEAILVEKEGGFGPHEVGLVAEAITSAIGEQGEDQEAEEPEEDDQEGSNARRARNGQEGHGSSNTRGAVVDPEHDGRLKENKEAGVRKSEKSDEKDQKEPFLDRLHHKDRK